MDPVKPVPDPWDEALERLLAFLNEFEVGGPEHRVRAALRIVDQARSLTSDDPPVRRVMRLTFAELDQWFGAALEKTEIPAARRLAAGALGLQMLPEPGRWSGVVLTTPPSEELKGLLAGLTLRTSPDLAVTSMTSREMNYGAIEAIAHETWHQFAWTPLLRAAALWTGIFFLALYVYDHFIQP